MVLPCLATIFEIEIHKVCKFKSIPSWPMRFNHFVFLFLEEVAQQLHHFWSEFLGWTAVRTPRTLSGRLTRRGPYSCSAAAADCGGDATAVPKPASLGGHFPKLPCPGWESRHFWSRLVLVWCLFSCFGIIQQCGVEYFWKLTLDQSTLPLIGIIIKTMNQHESTSTSTFRFQKKSGCHIIAAWAVEQHWTTPWKLRAARSRYQQMTHS